MRHAGSRRNDRGWRAWPAPARPAVSSRARCYPPADAGSRKEWDPVWHHARMSVAYRSPLAPDANEGLVALVTGGGTGLGRAIAREYARTGARVAIAGRRAEPLEEVASELASTGAEILSVPGTDVREPDQVGALVDAVLDRFGRIDVLVNNAGGQFVATPEAISAKGWRAVQRLNGDAVWDVTRT